MSGTSVARQPAKILVVDDELHIREVLVFDLQRSGYEVVQADCGKAGLEVVKAEAPALVISDVRMPSGTGVELLRWVKEISPLTPFIFMTAFSDISSDEALAQGAEAFIAKPFQKEEMLIEIRKALVLRPERWLTPMADAQTCRIDLDGLGGEHPARMNLGNGGAFVECADNLPDSLELIEFKLAPCPGGQAPLSGKARVRWVRHEPMEHLPAGLGLEFLYLEEPSLEDYMAYLEREKPRAFVPLGL